MTEQRVNLRAAIYGHTKARGSLFVVALNIQRATSSWLIRISILRRRAADIKCA